MIGQKSPNDHQWITEYLTDLWGSTNIYLPNGQYNASTLPALYTEDQEVVLTYAFDKRADIVTLNIPYGYNQASIDSLINTLKDIAQAQGHSEIFATTTNDNLDLMGYLQRSGFRFHKIYAAAVETARDQRAAIPDIGKHDIKIIDEIEFMLKT